MAAQMTVPRLCASLLVLFALIFPVQSYDPSPVKDFDIPGKLPTEVVATDFMSSNLRGDPPIAPGSGAAALGLMVGQFPALNTQGISMTKLKILPCGMNPPHIHPRGTELIHCLKGKVFTAFIDTNNKIFGNVLKAGDSTVFPRGLIHAVVNVGRKPALLIASFNSQNPGNTRVVPALFTSKDEKNQTFPSSILAAAFGVSPETIDGIKVGATSGFPLGSTATGCHRFFHGF